MSVGRRIIAGMVSAIIVATFTPTVNAVENTGGWYDELVESEAYKNYGTPPLESATFTNYAYSLLDIDQNGVPELILRSYNQEMLPSIAWPWYKIFTYDTMREQPVFVGDLCPYAKISYSSLEKAIACSPTKPNVYGYGTQFYGLTQQKLLCGLLVGWSGKQYLSSIA